MTISQKIIISSTLVACLAALAAFMGWKNTQPIQKELVQKLTHTTEEIRFLDDIKVNSEDIKASILANVEDINNGTIGDLERYAERVRMLDIRGKSLKVQIQAFEEFNKTPDSNMHIEEMLMISELLREQARSLFLRNNNLPSPVTALKTGGSVRKSTDELKTLVSNMNIHRFSLIKLEGEIVKTQISKLNFWIILIGGLTFLMAIVFGRVIASNLSQEISKLRTAATRLNKGDYSVRVGLKSNDEFGKLGKTFDGMAANLQQSKTIDDQKEELGRLNVELKTKNDSLDRFVYRVSHDLKAPIVNIKSLLSLIKIKMSAIENSDVKQSFFFLEKSADKLEQTILDLLEVSRIEKSLETTKEWINLERIIDKIIIENSEKISSHNVNITYNFKIPEINFSLTNLDSILTNLITNGIKYSSPNRQPSIHLESSYEDNMICLKVKDNGIGIDLKKHRKKLFGMFNRFHNHVEGSGVGLYIVKKLMEDTNGKIEVESQVGEGTTFSLYFLKSEETSLVNKEELVAKN